MIMSEIDSLRKTVPVQKREGRKNINSVILELLWKNFQNFVVFYSGFCPLQLFLNWIYL